MKEWRQAAVSGTWIALEKCGDRKLTSGKSSRKAVADSTKLGKMPSELTVSYHVRVRRPAATRVELGASK